MRLMKFSQSTLFDIFQIYLLEKEKAQELRRVALMPDVPDNLVLRGIKHVVESDLSSVL